MDHWLRVAVPRRLRIHATIQISNVRLSLRLFIALLGLGLVWGSTLLAGAELTRTAACFIPIGLLTTALLEGRLCGRSTWVALCVIQRHLRRPARVALRPLERVLLAEPAQHAASIRRRPRWQRPGEVEECYDESKSTHAAQSRSRGAAAE